MARWERRRAPGTSSKWSSAALGDLARQHAAPKPDGRGQTYRLRLEMSGTDDHAQALRQRRAHGLRRPTRRRHRRRQGRDHGRRDRLDAAQTDTTGMQFDNFQVTPSTYPRAADSKGTNTGDYKNGVTLGRHRGAAPGHEHGRAVRRRQRLRADDRHHRDPGRRSRRARSSVVQDRRARPGRCSSTTGRREHPGVRPLDRRGRRHDDGLGLRRRQRQGRSRCRAAVNNGAWHQVVADLQRHLAHALHRRRRARRAGRDPGHGDGRVRLRHRRRHRPRRRQLRRLLQRLDRRGLVLHHGAEPGHGHRPLPARQRALRRRVRTHRRLGRRHRPGRHRLALLDLDDAEPGAGQGHRPERRRRHRQPAAARHRAR